MSTLKRYNGTSWETIGGSITGDTLPIGSEVDYDGANVPAGWQEVDDPNTYSETETKIGYWIDGKPLYRKVIENTTPTTTDGTLVNKSIPINVSNVNFIYIDKALIVGGSTYNCNTLVSTMSFSYGVRFEVNSSNIVVYSNSSVWSNLPVKIVIEYTKTTD